MSGCKIDFAQVARRQGGERKGGSARKGVVSLNQADKLEPKTLLSLNRVRYEDFPECRSANSFRLISTDSTHRRP